MARTIHSTKGKDLGMLKSINGTAKYNDVWEITFSCNEVIHLNLQYVCIGLILVSHQSCLEYIQKLDIEQSLWQWNISLSQHFNTDSDYLQSFLQAAGVKSGTYNFASPVCPWPGVGCDIQHVHILDLTFTRVGLTGPVPENSFRKLMNLNFLDLDSNFITELASDIWGLSNLKPQPIQQQSFGSSVKQHWQYWCTIKAWSVTE